MSWPTLEELVTIKSLDEESVLCQGPDSREYTLRLLRGRPSDKIQKGQEQVLNEIDRITCLQALIDECEAGEVYVKLGVPFVRSKLYRLDNDKTVYLLTEHIVAPPVTGKLTGLLCKQLWATFVADALLANYDVCGDRCGAILLDGSQTLWRTRSGGFLHKSRCATCGVKQDHCLKNEAFEHPQFCRHPLALFRMRDKALNELQRTEVNWKVFGPVSIYEIMDQIDAMPPLVDISSTPEVSDIVVARIAELKEIAAFAHVLQADGWYATRPEAKRQDCAHMHVDRLIQQTLGLRHAGVSQKLVQELVSDLGDAYLLKDKDTGKLFGTLRGEGSAIAELEKYSKHAFATGDDDVIDTIVAYAKGVKNSSWDPIVQIFKKYFFEQRAVPPTEYFWGESASTNYNTGTFRTTDWEMFQQFCNTHRSRQFYMKRPDQIDDLLAKSISLWHAFTVELCRHTKFPGNDQGRCVVTVVRTESDTALEYFYDAVDGTTPCKKMNKLLVAKRGALESSSVYTLKFIHGHNATEQHVPYHRLFGLYITAQPKSVAHELSFFENDTENEFSFLPQGIEFMLKAPEDMLFAKPTKSSGGGSSSSNDKYDFLFM